MKTDVLLILFLYIFFTKLNDITILLSINVSGRPRRGVMDRNIFLFWLSETRAERDDKLVYFDQYSLILIFTTNFMFRLLIKEISKLYIYIYII